jgi:CheY-like chemotaxis protein
VPIGEVVEQKTVTPRLVADELKGLNILCLDNETRILAGMQALLEQWGCHVTCAVDLGECLEHWKLDKQPDVVLADYHLDAGETGLDVLKTLSYHWGKDLSAIVISANNTDELRQQAKESGYMFLAKPVQPGALRGMIRNIIRRKSVEAKEPLNKS